MATDRPTTSGAVALEAALRDGGELRRTFDGKPGAPKWPANANVLAALVRHKWMDFSERRNRRGHKMHIWTINQAGRDALEPESIVREDRPLYLAHIVGASGDYTPIRSRASDDLEIMDQRELNTRWSRAGRAKHARDRGTLNRVPGNRKAA